MTRYKLTAAREEEGRGSARRKRSMRIQGVGEVSEYQPLPTPTRVVQPCTTVQDGSTSMLSLRWCWGPGSHLCPCRAGAGADGLSFPFGRHLVPLLESPHFNRNMQCRLLQMPFRPSSPSTKIFSASPVFRRRRRMARWRAFVAPGSLRRADPL